MKKKLKDVCTQVRGVSYKPSDLRDENSGVPILRANNIQDTGIVLDELVYVDSSKVHSEQYLLTDDIVICASSGSKNLVGKAATFKSDLSASFGAFCKVVRINNSDDLCKAYIQQYFQSKIYRNAISESSAGANINNIKTEDIEALEIPLPSKEEQIKIAAELDTIQSAIDNKKQQLALLDEAVKSEFVEMFGENPVESGKWKVEKLEDISTVQTGGTPSRNHPEYFEGNIPWVTTANLGKNELTYEDAMEYISQDAINNSATKIIPANSLFIGIRVGVGKCSINRVDMCSNQDICGLSGFDTTIINLVFLKKVLDSYSDFFENAKRGTTIKGIKSDTIKKLKIFIPELNIQNQFASFIQQIDKSKFVLQQQLQFIKKYVIMTSWRKICFYTTVAM